MELLEPKEIEIDGVVYRIGKFPAVAGRELVAKYPLSNLPRVGDYAVSQATMLKLMSYVERVQADGTAVRLTTEALVNNHVKDWETLVKLEAAAWEHNCSFFQNGKALNFLTELGSLAQRKGTEMLTNLLAQLSAGGKPPSTN